MGFPALTSIIERRKVRRGVIGTAILFKDQRRVILQFRNPLKKDNLGTLTFDSKTLIHQLSDHRRQLIVVETLSQCVIKLHLKACVDLIELDS